MTLAIKISFYKKTGYTIGAQFFHLFKAEPRHVSNAFNLGKKTRFSEGLKIVRILYRDLFWEP